MLLEHWYWGESLWYLEKSYIWHYAILICLPHQNVATERGFRNLLRLLFRHCFDWKITAKSFITDNCCTLLKHCKNCCVVIAISLFEQLKPSKCLYLAHFTVYFSVKKSLSKCLIFNHFCTKRSLSHTSHHCWLCKPSSPTSSVTPATSKVNETHCSCLCWWLTLCTKNYFTNVMY